MSTWGLFRLQLKKEGARGSAANFLLTLIAGGGVIAVFVYIFFGLIRGFKNMGLSFELMGLVLGFIYLYLILTGTPGAAALLFTEDRVLLPLPISQNRIVFAKLAVRYVLNFIGSLVLFLPFFICFAVVNRPGAAYYAGSVTTALLLPLFAVLVSSLLAFPYRLLKRFFARYRLALLVIACLLLAALFLLYGKVLQTLNGLIEHGRLQYLFNEKNVGIIKNLVRYFIPIVFFTDLFAGRRLLLAISILIISAAAAAAALWFMGKFVRRKEELAVRATAGSAKIRTVGGALLFKEFSLILRSDGALLGYLTLLVSVPVLSYLSCSVLKSVIAAAIGQNFVFPFCLLLVLLFTVVCNLYAGGGLAREGSGFAIMRTLPVPLDKQLKVKLSISLLLMAASSLITGVALAAGGILVGGEGALAVLSAVITGSAVVLAAEAARFRGADSAISLIVGVLVAIITAAAAVLAKIFLGGASMYIFSCVLPALFLALYLSSYRKAAKAFEGGQQ